MKIRSHMSVVLMLLASSHQLSAMQYFGNLRQRFDQWQLSGSILNVINAYQKNNTCNLLVRRPAFARAVVTEHYEPSFWIKWGSKISPQESLFSYAVDIYTVIQNIIDGIFGEMDKIDTAQWNEKSQEKLSDIKRKRGELQSFLNIVLVSKETSVTQEDITGSKDGTIRIKGVIPRALEILSELIDLLSNIQIKQPVLSAAQGPTKPETGKELAYKWSQEKKKEFYKELFEFNKEITVEAENVKILLEKLEKGKKIINMLATKPRMSQLERWYLENQVKKIESYVGKYCMQKQ